MAARGSHLLYAALARACREKPEATEERVLGETVFRVGGRVFAFMGAPDRAAVTVRRPRDHVRHLLDDPCVRRARYIGWLGWITVTAEDERSLGLTRELIDASYRRVASAR